MVWKEVNCIIMVWKEVNHYAKVIDMNLFSHISHHKEPKVPNNMVGPTCTWHANNLRAWKNLTDIFFN